MIFILCLLIVSSQSKGFSLDTELVVYAQPTDIASWLDHTGVYTQQGDKYVFTCTGNAPITDKIRYTVNATGDIKKSITIVSGKYNSIRPNNIFNSSDDTCGIIYGIKGVCHQMTNRIMYAAGVAMDQSQLHGGSLSYTLYGVYGHEWDKYLNECEKQWHNETSYSLKENIISKSKGMMKKYLEIDFSDASEDIKIMKRIDLLLKYKHDNNLRIDKKMMYKAATDFIHNVYIKNDVEYLEDEFKKVNIRFKDVLGTDGYEQVFGIDYNLNKLTFQMK